MGAEPVRLEAGQIWYSGRSVAFEVIQSDLRRTRYALLTGEEIFRATRTDPHAFELYRPSRRPGMTPSTMDTCDLIRAIENGRFALFRPIPDYE